MTGSQALARLRRWEDAGGTWRVLARTDASASVSLCRCDGGEEVDRIVSEEPALADFLNGRSSSDEDAP